MRCLKASNLHFDIDVFLNPFVPANFVDVFPRPIAHCLGYRETPQRDVGNLLVAFWACLGAFLDIILIEAIFRNPAIQRHHPPLIPASFVRLPKQLFEDMRLLSQGAAVILHYNTIQSPLAHPIKAVFCQLFASTIAISIIKLFKYQSDFESIRWLATGLTDGISSALMTVTKTIYPPAGATALLAAADPTVQHLGWYFLPISMIGTILTIVTSLLINNIQRRYPTHWWTAAMRPPRKSGMDIEVLATKPNPSGTSSVERLTGYPEPLASQGVMITPERVLLPNGLLLTDQERAVMGTLQDRLGLQELEKQMQIRHVV